jgi:hypothetical protein
MRDFPEFSGPMATWPRVEAIPNVKEALEGLQAHWILALATNVEASDEPDIRAALRRVGLDEVPRAPVLLRASDPTSRPR